MTALSCSPPLQVTSIKTANYTARTGELVQCDAGGGSFTVTLPGSPRVNQIVGVKLLETTGGNSVTVARNGNAIEGEAGDLMLAEAGDYQELQYDGAGQWLALSQSATPATTVRFQPPNGRLTLTSGTPVPTSDVTGASTVYFTPLPGATVYLYDGQAWVAHDLIEISLALSGLTSGKNYDVFVYSNAGTPALELSAAWASNSARTDALTTQNGVPVKSGATTRLHIGTIRTTSTTTTEFSFVAGTGPKKGFVWNRYNQVLTPIIAVDSAGIYTYTTAAFRKTGNRDNAKVEYVLGDVGNEVRFDYIQRCINGSGVIRLITLGIDSATTPETNWSANASTNNTSKSGETSKRQPAGYHFAHILEWSEAVGTTTWTDPSVLKVHLWC